MKRAARRGLYDKPADPKTDYDPETDYIVTRCSNVQRNMVNEPHCKISYDADACVSAPLADPNQDYTVFTSDPGAGNPEPLYKFSPDYAGPVSTYNLYSGFFVVHLLFGICLLTHDLFPFFLFSAY